MTSFDIASQLEALLSAWRSKSFHLWPVDRVSLEWNKKNCLDLGLKSFPTETFLSVHMSHNRLSIVDLYFEVDAVVAISVFTTSYQPHSLYNVDSASDTYYKRRGRSRWWHISGYYPRIHLAGQRKATKISTRKASEPRYEPGTSRIHRYVGRHEALS
jgi:hypothetical protein